MQTVAGETPGLGLIDPVISVGGQAGRAIRHGPQHRQKHHRAPDNARQTQPPRSHRGMLTCCAMGGHLIRDMAWLLAATLILGTAANLVPGRRLAWWGAGQQPPQEGRDFQWMDVHSANEVHQLLPGAVFVDTRGPGAYTEAHIPGAMHLSYTELGRGLPTDLEEVLRRADLILLYGDTADADIEQLTAQELRRQGLAPPYILAGGLPAWRAAGLPVEPHTQVSP